jgi:hypothetical protein
VEGEEHAGVSEHRIAANSHGGSYQGGHCPEDMRAHLGSRGRDYC